MKIGKRSLIGCILLCGCGAAWAEAIQAKIEAVTLYADRVLIERTVEVAVGPELKVLELKGMPAWMDAGSVRARLEPSSAGEIVDVQVSRAFLAKTEDEGVQKAQAAVQEVKDRMGELQDALGVLAARKQQVERISAFTMEKIPRDAVTRDVPVQHYKDMVAFVSDELKAIAKEKRDLEKQLRDVQPELAAREHEQAELAARSRLVQQDIKISLTGDKAGKAQLIIRYFLPGATWEPVYEMRAEGNNVQLSAFARVTQTTGEDWTDVALSFSTQSPGRAVSVPKLEALLLGSSSGGQAFQGGGQSDSWNTANQLLLYNNANVQPLVIQRNWKDQKAVQERIVEQFNQLNDRGTTAIYAGMARQTVRADGNSVRIPVAVYKMAGRPRIVAAPEVSLNATRTLELTHTGDQPILPGSVSLFDKGAFLGTSSVDFVGSGETFILFAGLADQIKLSRVLDHKKSELRRGKRRNRMKVAYVATIENLLDEPALIRLADRIPVSDSDDIKVSYVSTSPSVKPDSDGLLVWDLEIPAKGKVVVRINYTVDYPNAPVAPNASKSLDNADDSIQYRLQKMETKF